MKDTKSIIEEKKIEDIFYYTASTGNKFSNFTLSEIAKLTPKIKDLLKQQHEHTLEMVRKEIEDMRIIGTYYKHGQIVIDHEVYKNDSNKFLDDLRKRIKEIK